MTSPAVGTRLAYSILPMIVAIAVALVVATIKPSLSLPLIIGTLILVVTFLSPEAGLYVLVFSMLLGPEFIVGGMGTGTTLGRGVTLRFDDLLLLLVGFGWLARTAISEDAGRFVRTPLNRAIMLYTAACVFATLMGMLLGHVRHSGGFFFLLKYYEYFFLFFMTVNIVTTEKQIKRLLVASLVTFTLVSLYCLAQIPSGQRVSAPFEGVDGEPNTLGGYLVFMMAVVAGLLLTPGATTKKLPLLALLGLGGMVLQATLSRASFLSAIVVVVAVLDLARRRSPTLLGILLLSLIVFVIAMPNSVVDRMMYTFTQPKESGQIEMGGIRIDTSTSERLHSWQEALDVFWRSPLWGAGVTGGPFMDAMYPRVLTETGLLGISAFFYLLWRLFQMGLTAYHSGDDPFVRGLALGFLLGLLGLVVHAIGANSFIIVRIMEPFWLFTALLVKAYILKVAPEGSDAYALGDDMDARRLSSTGAGTRMPLPLGFKRGSIPGS